VGLDLLRQGANAADTAIAVAAVLAVTEPCSTGLGGDMFCLYYNASTKQVTAVNGSGQSPAALTYDMLCQTYPAPDGSVNSDAFMLSPHSVTVPGAARGWEDTLQRLGSGKFTMAQLVEPAAQLAEEGFPVAPVTAHHWEHGFDSIRAWHPEDGGPLPLTVDGQRPPEPGDLLRNPDMARVLRDLGAHGAQAGFYEGTTGQAIVQRLQELGGCLTMEDLAKHTSLFPDPIAADYRGCKLWQHPPNGQGLAGLIALTGLKHLEAKEVVPPIETLGATDRLHLLTEMMRLGFADGRAYIADPTTMERTTASLLDPQRIGDRATRLFNPAEAKIQGIPDAASCTISFQVVDKEGNAISFVNSNFMGFGTGIVPKGCGFSLQNRGFGFTLQPGHPNHVEPSKRPYHTIIPGMLTHSDTGELYATLSNMGGNMQPQGHMQLTINLLARGMDPQAAIDEPRFCIADGTQEGAVFIEDPVPEEVLEALRAKGHLVRGVSESQYRLVLLPSMSLSRMP
jgi:gamma-glutamyltranspeptidase/glutathione hydrolase